MKFIALGDSHVPDRVGSIPLEIQDCINSLQLETPLDGIFWSGDFTQARSVIPLLRKWAGTGFLQCVPGNMDEGEYITLPLSITYRVPDTDLIIGLNHGTYITPRGDHIATEKLGLEMHVQILITGHTHAADVFLAPSGTLLLNPGSCVGAWSFIASGIPSFILLSIEGTQIVVDLFEKHNREIQKKEFQFAIEGSKIIPAKQITYNSV